MSECGASCPPADLFNASPFYCPRPSARSLAQVSCIKSSPSRLTATELFAFSPHTHLTMKLTVELIAGTGQFTPAASSLVQPSNTLQIACRLLPEPAQGQRTRPTRWVDDAQIRTVVLAKHEQSGGCVHRPQNPCYRESRSDKGGLSCIQSEIEQHCSRIQVWDTAMLASSLLYMYAC